NPLPVVAWLQIGASAYVASSVVWMPLLLSPPDEGGGILGLIKRAWLYAAPVVLPPTLASGMALPLAMRVAARSRERAGGDVGYVYALNTAGSIAGALVAGLALLPLAGASRSLAILAVVGASSGLFALRAAGATGAPRVAAIAVTVVTAAALFVSGQSVMA